MKKQAVRLGVDCAMTLLLLGQMGYHMMDNRLHEWTGIALFLLFLAHHALNAGWYRGLRKGRYTPQRAVVTALDGLLLLTMLTVMVSAVLVSRHAFDFLGLRMRAVGRRIHMPATMWAFVLMNLHIGLHLHRASAVLRKRAANRRGVLAACRLLALAVALYGAYEFIRRELWMELFMLREFAFLDYGEPLARFFLSYLSIMMAWAMLMHGICCLIRRWQAPIPAHARSETR